MRFINTGSKLITACVMPCTLQNMLQQKLQTLQQESCNKNTIFLETDVIVFLNDVSCPEYTKHVAITRSSIHYFAANWDVIVFLKYVLNTWRIMRYVSHLTSCVQTTSSSENQET